MKKIKEASPLKGKAYLIKDITTDEVFKVDSFGAQDIIKELTPSSLRRRFVSIDEFLPWLESIQSVEIAELDSEEETVDFVRLQDYLKVKVKVDF